MIFLKQVQAKKAPLTLPYLTLLWIAFTLTASPPLWLIPKHT